MSLVLSGRFWVVHIPVFLPHGNFFIRITWFFFHRNPRDRKSPLVSRTLLSILTDLDNVVVLILSFLLWFPILQSPFKAFVDLSKHASINIHYHYLHVTSCFNSQARSTYLKLFFCVLWGSGKFSLLFYFFFIYSFGTFVMFFMFPYFIPKLFCFFCIWLMVCSCEFFRYLLIGFSFCHFRIIYFILASPTFDIF